MQIIRLTSAAIVQFLFFGIPSIASTDAGVVGCGVCHIAPSADSAITASKFPATVPSSVRRSDQAPPCGICHSRSSSLRQLGLDPPIAVVPRAF